MIFLLSIPLAHAAGPFNATLLYGWNGTAPVPLLTDINGKLWTDINYSRAVGIEPRTNNTYNFGSSATQWLDIYATNVRSAGNMSLYAGGQERVVILAGGNVGVGNVNPGQALVVNGQANVTGTLIANGTMNIRGVLYNWPSADGAANALLSTDGSGGLSWGSVGSGSSNVSARNITAGTFGANIGNGDYAFPSNLSASQNISASGRVTDKSGFLAPVGMIVLYSGALAPNGWLIANGSEVNRTTYPDLFNVTGTIYGNTSDSTFKLPDFRQRIPLGKADTGTGSTLGGTGGNIDHTHTGPSHTHAYSTMIAHTHAVDPASTASDSQGSHTHSVDPASTSSASGGAHVHSVDPPSTSVSLSDPGHSGHAERANARTAGSTYAAGDYDRQFSCCTGSSTTGISGSSDPGVSTSTSGGGSTHTYDLGSTISASGGGSTHATDIASFTSGSTGSASGTSDAGGTGATGTGNPPFIALYYIIKY